MADADIALEILSTGPLAVIEDLGRPGLAHLGVSRSGAADHRAHGFYGVLSPVNQGQDAAVRYVMVIAAYEFYGFFKVGLVL